MILPKVVKGTPSTLTITSLILGLWSIRFSVNGQLLHAVACVLVCIVLDGFDGKLARYLDNATEFGATLDTLADFTSFGIAPIMITYFTFTHNRILWIACIVFVVCMALRLARFAQTKAEHESFFIGVPAPAGALLGLTPMFAILSNLYVPSSQLSAVCLFLSAFLMISKLPTFAIMRMKLSSNFLPIFAVLLTLALSYALFHPWSGILLINLFYVCTFPFSFTLYKKFITRAL